MKKHIFIILFLLPFTVAQSTAQQKTNAEKADSIVAVLPRLSGNERLSALLTLTNLTC